MTNWRPKAEPHFPPDYDDLVIWAARALSQGRATEAQQKHLWRWLMYVTAASEEFQDLSYRPGEQGIRSTDFAEGKRFVGQQLRKLLRPELTPKSDFIAKPEAVAAPTSPEKPRRAPRPRKK